MILALVFAILTLGPSAAAAAPLSLQATGSDTVVVPTAARTAGPGRLLQTLSMGSVTGSTDYVFGTVSGLLPLRDGSVLVLEAQVGTTPRLRQYDAMGRFVRVIGSFGDGPGQFRAPSGLAQFPDGRLLLLDGALRRIQVYSESGLAQETWPFPDHDFPTSYSGAGALQVLPSGNLSLLTFRVERDGASGFRFVRSVLIVAPGGRVVEDLPAPVLPSAGRTEVRKVSGGAMISLGIPYSPEPIWAWSPLGYMVTAVTNRYAVDLRLPQVAAAPSAAGAPPIFPLWRPGDPVRSLRRDPPPVPVSREERRDQLSRIEDALAPRPGTLDGPMPEIAEVKPPIRSVVVGRDGTIWVSRSTASERYDPSSTSAPASTPVTISGGGSPLGGASQGSGAPPIPLVPWREPTLYDVFAPDGRFLGQVAVPYGTTLFSLGGDVVWGVTRGDFDVPIVMRFRVEWAGGGG